MERLQNYLHLARYPLRQHFGVVHGPGVEAVRSESLFIANELKDPSEEDRSMRALDGLHEYILT